LHSSVRLEVTQEDIDVTTASDPLYYYDYIRTPITCECCPAVIYHDELLPEVECLDGTPVGHKCPICGQNPFKFTKRELEYETVKECLARTGMKTSDIPTRKEEE